MESTVAAFTQPESQLAELHFAPGGRWLQGPIKHHHQPQFRAFDSIQEVIRENSFLADFLRAHSNGFLTQWATGVFNTVFNPNLGGSQRPPTRVPFDITHIS